MMRSSSPSRAVAAAADSATTTADEIPVTNVLEKLWDNLSTFADLQLRSKVDGSTIQCQRAILASRSEYFNALLYGKFSESNKSVVDEDYSTQVLQLIVEYCYKDDLAILHLIDKEKESAEPSSSTSATSDDKKGKLPLLIDLQSAADYLGFPKLSKMVTQVFVDLLEKYPTNAWLVFTGGHVGDNIRQVTLDVICSKLDDSISTGIVPSDVPSDVIEYVVSNKTIIAKEIDIFRVIQLWVVADDDDENEIENMNAKSVTGNNIIQSDDSNKEKFTDANNNTMIIGKPPGKRRTNDDEDADTIEDTSATSKQQQEEQEQQNRIQFAKSLVEKYIQFEKITPMELKGIVEPSGFVSKDKLCEIYQQQAELLFKQKQSQTFDFNPIRGPYWKSTGRRLTTSESEGILNICFDEHWESACDFVIGQKMKTGAKYSWSIKIVNAGCGGWASFGVATLPFNWHFNRILGRHKNGWEYLVDGCYYYGESLHGDKFVYEELPPIGFSGSVVTLTLDLTDKGTLSVREDSCEKKGSMPHKDEIILFENMLVSDDGETNLDLTFVPAVSIFYGDEFEFLGFNNIK